MEKMFLSVLVFISVCLSYCAGQTTTSSPDTYPWENCTVIRYRERTCNTGNCTGASNETVPLEYSICPLITADDVAKQQDYLENQKVQTLLAIDQATNQTIQDILVTYKTRIETSVSFGYIAAIFICFLFAMPLILDIHKFFIYLSERKKTAQARQF